MNLFRLRTIAFLFLACFAIGLVIQHAGLHAEMYYDSAGNIAEKRNVFAWQGLPGVLSLFPQRPLPTASFYLNFLIRDMNPLWFRVVNIALLAGVSILVMVVMRLLLEMTAKGAGTAPAIIDLVSVFAGLVFLVHPLQTFLTLYIWQRMGLMACLFSYACLAVYLVVRSGKWSRPWLGYALCFVLFVAATLSKENSITLPVILVLADRAFFFHSWKAMVARAGMYVLVTLVVCSGISFLQHPHGNAQLGTGILSTISAYYAESGLTLQQVIFTQSRVVFSYLSVIIFPIPSHVQLINPQTLSLSLTDPPVTVGAVTGVLGMVLGGLYLLNRMPLWGFGILFFLVNVVPEGFLVPQYAFFGYRPVLPMFGVLLILVDCVQRLLHMLWFSALLRPARAGVLALMAGSIMMLATSTALKADLWRDPIRFWNETVAQFPRDQERMERKVASHALGNLAAALYRADRYEEAATYYERAMELSPEDPRKMVSLAAVYAESGRVAESEVLLVQAIERSPDFAEAYRNLAIVLIKRQNLDRALETVHKGLERAQGNESLYEIMGQIQLMKKDVAAAVASFRRAIHINPRSAELYFRMGQALLAQGNHKEAERSFHQAVALRPDFWEAYNVLGITYANQGKPEEALTQFQRALAIDPGNPRLRSNVDTAVKQIQGRTEESGRAPSP